MHPAMQHLARQRAEDKRQEDERRRLRAEADTRRQVREREQRAARVPYGNTSSYTPASDTCSAPFVPAAESYSPPPAEPTPRYEGDGLGSFDGGGASGEY